MKYILSFLLLFPFAASFSQWTKVQQLPSSDIASFYHEGNTLYAGGRKIIYISPDNGLTWDSTGSIPQLAIITCIIVYKNEIYAAAPNGGAFKSHDAGKTWQDVNTGLYPHVGDFCEFRGDLYAGTLGNSIYKLDPVNRDHWLLFNNGTGSISSVINSMAANSNAMVAGANNNGLYDYLPAGSTTWEERFLLPNVSVNEGAFDIIAVHDTLVWPGKTGSFYMSTDNGLNWHLFANRLVTGNTSVVNAKQAFLASTYVFDGTSVITGFHYIKKDALQGPFINFSAVRNHFTYNLFILGDKLWDGSDKGLFFMSLSELPGITADDSDLIVVPIHFSSFNVSCEAGKVLVKWKTAQELNSSHYNIERSMDAIRWTVVGNLPARGNSGTESGYSFTDNAPAQNSFYRIAAYDQEGKVQYSTTAGAGCVSEGIFIVFPNPVREKLSVNIVSRDQSKISIRLFDSKGALVRWSDKILHEGNNLANLDMQLLAKGTYYLSATWSNGLQQRKIKVVKQ